MTEGPARRDYCQSGFAFFGNRRDPRAGVIADYGLPEGRLGGSIGVYSLFCLTIYNCLLLVLQFGRQRDEVVQPGGKSCPVFIGVDFKINLEPAFPFAKDKSPGEVHAFSRAGVGFGGSSDRYFRRGFANDFELVSGFIMLYPAGFFPYSGFTKPGSGFLIGSCGIFPLRLLVQQLRQFTANRVNFGSDEIIFKNNQILVMLHVESRG